MRIHLFLLAALAWFASCGHSDIHQAIKQMAETAIDTTGFATRSVNTNRFSSVEIDCFADVDFIQTDGAAMPHVCIAAPPAVIDTETRLPADLTQLPEGSFADILMPGNTPPIAPMARMRMKEPQLVATHKAAYCDLDINGHVNSIRYIELMLNATSTPNSRK